MKITIEQRGSQWHVGQEDGENVYPSSVYPTARLAMSRALQLLSLGPVGPQAHPEIVCIGEIEYDRQEANEGDA